jgi:hypothetical protein
MRGDDLQQAGMFSYLSPEQRVPHRTIPCARRGRSPTSERPGMYVYFFAPLLKIVLFSAAGMYLLRGGAWLVRLLDCYPDTVEKGGGEGEA